MYGCTSLGSFDKVERLGGPMSSNVGLWVCFVGHMDEAFVPNMDIWWY